MRVRSLTAARLGQAADWVRKREIMSAAKRGC